MFKNAIQYLTKVETGRCITVADIPNLKAIPLDRLILETDAPYLTPHPFRGKVNEPTYVREVVRYFGRQRNLSGEAIASATTKNIETLFQIKFH